MVATSNGGLMKNTYADPEARQVHRDAGAAFLGSVVHFLVDGTHQGSGVLVGDGSCVLMSNHQYQLNGITKTAKRLLQISTGPNYFTHHGELITIIDHVSHPNAPASGQLGPDLVVAKLPRKPVNARPLVISAMPPQIGDILKLAGFGYPHTYAAGALPATGELLGGQAPVHELPATGYITTKFTFNSSIPLIFGATGQDSGGALVAPDGNLSGTIVAGTNPASIQYTYSIDLSLPSNRNWVHQSIANLSVTPAQITPVLALRGAANGELIPA